MMLHQIKKNQIQGSTNVSPAHWSEGQEQLFIDWRRKDLQEKYKGYFSTSIQKLIKKNN